jgi:hypothetical protein
MKHTLPWGIGHCCYSNDMRESSYMTISIKKVKQPFLLINSLNRGRGITYLVWGGEMLERIKDNAR